MKPKNRFVEIILWPGDMICRLFGVKDLEDKFFLRLYVNIFIHSKIAVGIAVLLAMWESGAL